jgi:hypothetical protein
LIDFLRQWWTGADKTHFASQHVNQLRKFIQTTPAQKPSDTGNSRVVVHLERRSLNIASTRKSRSLCISPYAHCSQLEHAETSTIPTDPLLDVEHRPAIIQANAHRQQREQWSEEKQPQSSTNYV